MKLSRRGALLAGGLGAAAVGGGYAVATRHKPAPPPTPAADAQGHQLWRNWSGVQHAYPTARLTPRDEDELAQALRTAAAPIRPTGAGHAFTALVPTDGTLVSLDALSGILGWDGDEAVVAAGTRLGGLAAALAARGRALASLPDTDQPSLAGALSTGTHGAGAALKALHGEVTALRLVTPRGAVIDCDATREADIFQAARVSLGALGVITRARIRTVAGRRLERRVWLEPVENALASAEDRWARHRHFALRVAPFTGLAVNVSHDPTDKPAQSSGLDPDVDLLDTLEGLRDRLGFAAPLRRAAARALLAGVRPQTAIDEGWTLLAAARPRRFNAMAFHLPAEVQMKALAEVTAAIEKHQSDAFLPIECRRTAPDDAWLSPFQGGPTGSITVRVPGKDDFAFLYTLVEPIFRRHGGRPHWGMLHSVSGDQLAGLYPRWRDFLKVRAALDPDGRMLNPYLKGLFGV